MTHPRISQLMPQLEYLRLLLRQPPPNSLASSASINHCLRVSLQVRPANLPLPPTKPVVCAEAIRRSEINDVIDLPDGLELVAESFLAALFATTSPCRFI